MEEGLLSAPFLVVPLGRDWVLADASIGTGFPGGRLRLFIT